MIKKSPQKNKITILEKNPSNAAQVKNKLVQ